MAITLKVSPLVVEYVNRVITAKDAPESLKRDLSCYMKECASEKCMTLPYSVLKQLYEHITTSAHSQLQSESKIYFHEFLQGCEVYTPPMKQPERNPELVARLERLKREQEQKQYNEMTSNVSHDTYGQGALSGLGREVKSVKKQLMAILNFVLTLVGSFTFGYMAGYYAGQPVPVRVFIGLFLALITAAADLYFMVKTEV